MSPTIRVRATQVFRLRSFVVSLVVFVLTVGAPGYSMAAGPGSRIEADPNKQYRLSKRNGPWMIMVASMQDVPKERRTKHGLSAQEAADRMVLAIRQTGIPAYTFSQKQAYDEIKTSSRRTGEKTERKYISQHDRVVVVAGNYPAAKDANAQKTLNFVKGLAPEVDPGIKLIKPHIYLSQKKANERFGQLRKGFMERLHGLLKDPRNGAVYRPTPGRPDPLSRAFLMPNPLLSPKEVMGSKRDPLLINLNKDMEHTLVACPSKYSLVVATFRGKTSTHLNQNALEKSASKLDEKLGTTLDRAALDAWRMTEALRTAKSLGYDRDYEAYVYHDRYQSIVTIGSFDSKTDPRIKILTEKFRAKMRVNPQTGEDVLGAEILAVPRRPKRNKLPDYTWIFDPKPELIEVPRLR